MVLSELINSIRDSVVAKPLLGALAAGCTLLVLPGCGSGNDYGPQVSAAEVTANAQKQLDDIKANKNLPPGLKDAEIKHLEGEIGKAQGKGSATQAGPPPGGKP